MSFTDSYTKTFVKRLLTNKGAMFGLVVISLSFVIAFFAYFIAPDHTPNANQMTVEIGGKKPGFTMQFLKVRNAQVEKTSFLQRLLNGKEEQYDLLPITGYKRIKDSIIVEKYIDEGLEERQSFHVGQLEDSYITTRTFLLGSDKFGRDILSRLIVGIRVSLSVGLIAVTISLLLGIMLGSLAGYFNGWTDDIIMWFINVIWSIPTLLLVFALTLLLGKGFLQVFIAVGLTMWVNVARLVRGQVMAVRELEYIEATRALGYSNTRTIFFHILPNILGPVMVIAASNFASAIVIEAGLSFLGVGVQPPQPSWGLMIKENYNFIITHNPALALAPGIAIMILVLAFNMLGNGLRDALNVRGRV
ncbi:ABC transporter permease [Segetibacter koreensis]|uniref:ABC transporter permease n=1 Tax=Segetibacter koreensis TaxID=398037 RepID=UPI000362C1F9|nr:ABC transporter permease [Segetibacter koreensis]